MTRIAFLTKNGHEAAFGLDHVRGWFYEEYDEENEHVFKYNQLVTPFFGHGQLLDMIHSRADDQELARLNVQLLRVAQDRDPDPPACDKCHEDEFSTDYCPEHAPASGEAGAETF